ncbi:hypothetical protein AUC61_14950 [Pseudomonas sp. S25]|uniref:Uncharacterized protein n=1 Tax=Pseudomonas maioricensis TaxID=1766623 RepID=A0ABS9ZKR8_9PSED|nr:hypothetical protein [Pseudomonas sp. S25]
MDFDLHLRPKRWERIKVEILADTGSIQNQDYAHLIDADIRVMWASSGYTRQGRTVLGQAEHVMCGNLELRQFKQQGLTR